MTNAVERLWAALAADDRVRAASELHDNVVVERVGGPPGAGGRLEGVSAYLAAVPEVRALVVRHLVTQGRQVASDVRLEAESGAWEVAGFFTLHDGRVLHATEYWLPAS